MYNKANSNQILISNDYIEYKPCGSVCFISGMFILLCGFVGRGGAMWAVFRENTNY